MDDRRRLEFHEKLCDILGTRHVYFQKPANVRMHYPAIVYGLGNLRNGFANNGVYSQKNFYTVTVIDPDPEGEASKRLSLFPKCQFSTRYCKDNLYHDVYEIKL